MSQTVPATHKPPSASWLKTFDPRAQIICYVCFIIGVYWVTDWPVLAALCAMSAALAVFARVRWRDARPAIRWVTIYIAIFTPIFLYQGQTTKFVVLAALRLLIILLASLVIVRTFEPRKAALACHGLGVPDNLAFTFSLMWRYVDKIGEDVNAAKEAQMARGLELEGRRGGFFRRVRGLTSFRALARASATNLSGFFRRLYVLTAILTSAVVGIISESPDVEDAMDLRGFAAIPKRTWLDQLRWRPRDTAAVIGFVLLAVLLVYYYTTRAVFSWL